jgi:hypothetical protein
MTNQKRKGEIISPLPPFHVERYEVKVNGQTVFRSDRAQVQNVNTIQLENKGGER